ncbi:hypothetical protein GCM10023210_03470 [Chryseobacterium ginsengisoli]|uniref:Lipoprotein n=1 Tax=Chryseobacterium ginsengisoli TaxID=363853 RepID=A0ABP9LV51_9FLAO
MKNRIFQLLVLTTFFIQCQNKKEQENIIKPTNTSMQQNINNGQIKEILDKQSYLENEETEDKYNLSKIDIDILSDLISKDLKNKGYKEPSSEVFLQKINSIFNLDTKCNQHGQIDTRYLVYHGNLMDGTQNTLKDNLFEPYIETGNIFFDQKNTLFTNFILLKNIVKVNGQNLSVHVPQNIVAQNKYIFNDSKADYAWLKANDSTFLESLVKTFGYTKNKELSIYVLEKNSDSDEFGKILWNKRCNGEIKFNKDIIDIIAEFPKDKQTKYLNIISDYIVKEVKNNNAIFNDNFSKKAEVLGKLAYYSEKIGEKIDMQYQFFSIIGSVEGGEAYEKEFSKNNYYNISDFKKAWDETRTGGIGYPGME